MTVRRLNDCLVFVMHLAGSDCAGVKAEVNVFVDVGGTKAEVMVDGNGGTEETGLAVRCWLK